MKMRDNFLIESSAVMCLFGLRLNAPTECVCVCVCVRVSVCIIYLFVTVKHSGRCCALIAAYVNGPHFECFGSPSLSCSPAFMMNKLSPP